MTADDERRAEIEAVARELHARLAHNYSFATCKSFAVRAIAALDRVRDARGDESHTKACVQGEIDSECPCEAARSPQDEGQEYAVMADDERRAEIEAMARAMYEGAHRRWAIDPKTTRWPGAHKSVSFDALDKGIRGAYLDEAEDSLVALAALDRVRDARGDNEVRRLRAINAELVEAHNTLLVAAARSPQDEDHEKEARIAAHHAAQDYVDAAGGDEVDTGHVVDEALNAYLAARSPQGEDHGRTCPECGSLGEWNACPHDVQGGRPEQPPPDALGGQPPAEPPEAP